MVAKLNLHNPCIISPSHAEGVEKLHRGEFDDIDGQYFSFTRESLYKLLDTGFFDYLNEKYDLFIGDYEQEGITKREQLLTILNEDIDRYRDLKNKIFWDKFSKCIVYAIERQTGVFFLF